MIEKRTISIKILLTLLIVSAMIYLGRVGIADFLLLAPRAYVDSVHTGSVRFDPVELVSVRERLLLARSWDRSNPTIHEYLGHVAFMRAQLFGSVPALQVLFLSEAAEDFDTAILNRPNSGVLWADRMVIASQYLEVLTAIRGDSALVEKERAIMKKALRRAAQLSPWDPPVLLQLCRVSAKRYGDFTSEERVLLDAATARAKQLNLQF